QERGRWPRRRLLLRRGFFNLVPQRAHSGFDGIPLAGSRRQEVERRPPFCQGTTQVVLILPTLCLGNQLFQPIRVDQRVTRGAGKQRNADLRSAGPAGQETRIGHAAILLTRSMPPAAERVLLLEGDRRSSLPACDS